MFPTSTICPVNSFRTPAAPGVDEVEKLLAMRAVAPAPNAASMADLKMSTIGKRERKAKRMGKMFFLLSKLFKRNETKEKRKRSLVNEKMKRIFNEKFQFVGKSRHRCPINDTMIGRPTDRHQRSNAIRRIILLFVTGTLLGFVIRHDASLAEQTNISPT